MIVFLGDLLSVEASPKAAELQIRGKGLRTDTRRDFPTDFTRRKRELKGS